MRNPRREKGRDEYTSLSLLPYGICHHLEAGLECLQFSPKMSRQDVKGVVQDGLQVHEESVHITGANYKLFHKQTTVFTNITLKKYQDTIFDGKTCVFKVSG